MIGREVFSLGIGPLVLFCTGNVEGAWSHEREELVLINGDLVFLISIGLELVAEPVGEGAVDYGGGFAEAASGQCSTALAGVVGDDDGEAFVLGSGPK